MALVNAFKAHEHEGWFLRPETRGAFRFLEQVPSELKEGTLPHQTTALRQLAWSVVKDGERHQTLDILDYPGEVYRLAFLNAEDENDPDEFRARVQAHQEEIKGFLGHLILSEHIFVLFNLSDAKDLGSNAKNLDAVWVTNACLDYLHRLPHKPRITLLLTQIDRYVDLEQYEFDPKVYVSHYLPLLANNFPNLDVCAVAALGAADSTYGIDSILLRSLFNASAVQGAITQVQKYRRNLKRALATSATGVNFCPQVVEAITDLSCEAHLWQQSLPWFIKAEKLIAPNGLVDAKTCEECKLVVADYYVVLQGCKNSPSGRAKLLEYLRGVTTETKEAALLVRAIYRSLQAVAQQGGVVESSKDGTTGLTDGGAIAILIVAIVILVVVVSVVWTIA